MIEAINVTALNKYVKELLERDSVLTDIAIRGEVSNFVNHYKTGHFYFSIKDEKCSVKAVMFRGDAQKLSFMPENGMGIIAFCRVSLFERDGSFQIYVTEMLPDGVGAMQLAFEQLKLRLEKEGLFDEKYKKKLPVMPKSIAVVTSKTSAALQDIINVITRRYPVATLILVPVTVQGSEAKTEIAKGIKKADCCGADVIIVARGGGSKEDLWVFNEEIIARAAFEAKTPLVSAIGHEIDFSILDFVADMRAPTPSAAAELTTPDFYEYLAKNTKIYTNIKRQLQNYINLCYNNLKSKVQSHSMKKTMLLYNELSDGLIKLNKDMSKIASSKILACENNLQHAASVAETVSPLKVIARGYAVLEMHGETVTSVKGLKSGDNLNIRMRDGNVLCNVDSVAEVK